MVKEILLRFIVGGLVVSGFALIGDIFKPKSFAGIFGAAPSVALATLGLAVSMHGRSYAAMEARSMTGGAIAFFVYTACAAWLLKKQHLPALLSTILLIPVWLAVALGSWEIFLK